MKACDVGSPCSHAEGSLLEFEPQPGTWHRLLHPDPFLPRWRYRDNAEGCQQAGVPGSGLGWVSAYCGGGDRETQEVRLRQEKHLYLHLHFYFLLMTEYSFSHFLGLKLFSYARKFAKTPISKIVII